MKAAGTILALVVVLGVGYFIFKAHWIYSLNCNAYVTDEAVL